MNTAENKHRMIHNLKNSEEQIIQTKQKLPVISYVTAGAPQTFEMPYTSYCDEHIEVPFEIKDPDAFALRIFGDSMYPKFLDGDYVIASPNQEPRNNQPVIAMINKNETTCKLFLEQKDHICLSPINPEYRMIICNKKDVEWVFPIIGMYRKEF